MLTKLNVLSEKYMLVLNLQLIKFIGSSGIVHVRPGDNAFM